MMCSSLFFSAVYLSLYSIDVCPLSRLSTIFPQGTDPFASFAYQTWVTLFYGGFYYIAWRLNHRAERTREILGQGELARMRTETLPGATPLQALRGPVDPRFLLRGMTEAERPYAHAACRAHSLP